MLRFLTIVLPAALFGYKTTDYFDAELVCVHVYALSQKLPDPLLESTGKINQRQKGRAYFQIGLPELILCRTATKLLDMFEYFWPVTRPEIRRFQSVSKVLFSLPNIENMDQVSELQSFLTNQKDAKKSQKDSMAVILTLNDYTQHACRRLIQICQENGVDDLVIFKDPSKPPYLCSYPSQQKGFKKKPPIGGGFNTGTVA